MDLKAAAQRYEEATAQFLEVVSQLSDSQLDASSDGSWSARQVIHHVADSEAQSYARLRRLIAEPGTQIQGYDEAGWGENETLGYKDLPIAQSLEVFRASALFYHVDIRNCNLAFFLFLDWVAVVLGISPEQMVIVQIHML